MTQDGMQDKAQGALKTIREVAELLELPQHVLRFWETKFPQIKPLKMKGARRYYRPEDVEIILRIKHLLYDKGYTIKGARHALSAKNLPYESPDIGFAPQAEEVAQPAFTLAIPPVARRTELQMLKTELLELKAILQPHL